MATRLYTHFSLYSQDNIRLELGRGRNISVLRSFRTVAQRFKVLVDAPNQVLLLT